MKRAFTHDIPRQWRSFENILVRHGYCIIVRRVLSRNGTLFPMSTEAKQTRRAWNLCMRVVDCDAVYIGAQASTSLLPRYLRIRCVCSGLRFPSCTKATPYSRAAMPFGVVLLYHYPIRPSVPLYALEQRKLDGSIPGDRRRYQTFHAHHLTILAPGRKHCDYYPSPLEHPFLWHPR